MSEKKEEELQEAARRVMSLLQSALSQPAARDRVSADFANQPHTSRQEVPQQKNTLEQNMARSFPGLFVKNLGKKVTGKRGPHSTVTDMKRRLSTVKCFPVQFYLVNKYMEKTPKAVDELTLLQSGMGRRTISITDDADHSWLSTKLEETYSKMADLKGAWMLYKAVGGSGQRELCIVPPEAEGYTGAYLNTVARGKSTLYIVPIQGTLDTSPLPYTAKEFEKMPKAACDMCSENMPVQLLAAHVASCKTVELSSDSAEQTCLSSPDNSPAMEVIVQNFPDDTPSVDTSVTTACPICEQFYPSDFVEIHASYCGERFCDETEAIDFV
ncbi:uncharacterized protein LOC130564407 isoform X2 [Triplophysa rosa]|uniref:uncharacterized protein LOC130564407 isoform X2 n=1 Tax=Triplophysa rosa TaxID=992332 RepID=UPI0025463986|nr:uncharacterized protein LOC130564407 isoform X2 [Triplophysa rosa]